MNGLTLDAGALIKLESRDRRVMSLVRSADDLGQLVTVPASVVVEWWRGQRGQVARLLDKFEVEDLSLHVARMAGEALARVRSGPSPTDAVVMASAALRGDIVLTGDIADLSKLLLVFPGVRLLRV